MASFGERSSRELASCHPDLQRVLREAIKHYDFAVLEGHRPKDQQDEAVRTGKSKLRWPLSKHNATPSHAVDIAPYPIDWNDTARFYYLAGLVLGIAAQMGVTLRWGGNWDMDGDFRDQSFFDLPHFEIVQVTT